MARNPFRYLESKCGQTHTAQILELLKADPQLSSPAIYKILNTTYSKATVHGLVGDIRLKFDIPFHNGGGVTTHKQIDTSISYQADIDPIFPELDCAKATIIFDGLEDGEYTPRPPYILPYPSKVLVLNDIHIPYHNREALLTALTYGREQGCDTIYLNGDIVDFYACSRWSKNPDKNLLRREVQIAHNFFAGLRKMFPKAKIVFKAGNHENRFDRYIIDVAPAMFGMEGFDIPSILKLKEFDIDYVDEKTICIAGELNFLHGHEVRFGGVNVARSMLLKASTNVIFGHFHVSQDYTQRSLLGKVNGCWAVGCLCDLKPDYHPINNWNHGFAVVKINEDGTFTVDNKKIIDGKVL